MTRLVAVAIVALWLASIVALVARDVWPRWTAQDLPPPPACPQDLQVGIFDAWGRRMGTAWTKFHPGLDNLTIQSTTVLEALPAIGPVRIETRLSYFRGVLDEVRVELLGAGVPIVLRGENMGGGFPCELRIGPIRRTFAFDAETTRMLSESLRPFNFLPKLRVGQRWRIRLFNPLQALLGRRAEFESLLVRVTGKETIRHGSGRVECFRLEAGQVVAFVDRSGRVLEQRVKLPVVGTVVLRDEPFDDAARRAAIERVPARKS